MFITFFLFSVGDYSISPLPVLRLNFNSNTGNMMECIVVSTLTADSDFEGAETFTVEIDSADAPIVASESASVTTITILDLQGSVPP